MRKDVGEQRSDMHRGVQVIDKLGADGTLRENEFDSGQGVSGVAPEDLEKCVVFLARLELVGLDERSVLRGEVTNAAAARGKQLAQLPARLAAGIAREPLRGIGEHELVGLFDCLAAMREIFPRCHARNPDPKLQMPNPNVSLGNLGFAFGIWGLGFPPTTQRCGS